jgi:hypothetical protein
LSSAESPAAAAETDSARARNKQHRADKELLQETEKHHTHKNQELAAVVRQKGKVLPNTKASK